MARITLNRPENITEMFDWGDANAVMRRARLYQTMANALEEL